MKVLIVGGGGREHAIAWRLVRDGHVVIAAPGNPGIAALGECVDVGAGNLDGQEALAVERAVDLVVIGPEVPLAAGLADRIRQKGIATFGPGKEGAQLEGSKGFGKRFFERHGIKTSEFREVDTVAAADAAIDELGGELVVKADGLAAGKGVVVCADAAEAKAAARIMLEDHAFGDAGDRLVIERRLRGRELSVMAITDGQRYEILAQAEDHKAIFDGDRGPNTGGMGTVSPAAWAEPALIERIEADVLQPTIKGLAADGIEFCGVLYAGLMVDAEGVPWILEYNCRFGDPETQPVLARLKGDFGALLAGAARGELPAGSIEWDPRSAVCVILASAGYPESSHKGDVISGLEALEGQDDVLVFHAGTAVQGDNIVTAGGRVLGVTALGDDTNQARQRAYDAVEAIEFDGMQFRRDIGARGTNHLGQESARE
jgi:phosphoribosylamine--glycine ligase